MTRLNQNDLSQFQNILSKMKNSEQKELESISQRLSEILENGKDENNTDTTSYSIQVESLMNSKNRVMKHLKHIENALLRITNNTYGLCIETGKAIPKERLIAVPTTTMSIEGKQIREKRTNQNSIRHESYKKI